MVKPAGRLAVYLCRDIALRCLACPDDRPGGINVPKARPYMGLSVKRPGGINVPKARPYMGFIGQMSRRD